MAENLSRQEAQEIARNAAQRRVDELTPRQRATLTAQFAVADKRAQMIMSHGCNDHDRQ